MSSILERGVYHAHCLDFLERVPDGSVQVVYLDPPSAAQLRDRMTRDEYKALIDKTIRQIHRVLRPAGSVFFQTTRHNALLVRPYLMRYFGEDLFLDEQFLRNVTGEVEYVISFARSEATRQRPVYMPVNYAQMRDFHKDREGQLYRLEDLTFPVQRPALQYEFKGFTPVDRSWRYHREKLQEFDEQGLIEISRRGVPRLRRYLSPENSVEVTNDWSDVPDEITEQSEEYKDFETQRPIELLRRIITIASDANDTVLDPFCGSGTAFVVAERLNRKWIGCDVDQGAYHKSLTRLEQDFGFLPQRDYQTGDNDVLKSKYPIISSSTYRRFFISYSRRDASEFVDPFCSDLRAAGIDYWRDRESIPNGAEWRAELDKALEECDALILFRTPDALQSDYVDEEWRAFYERGKAIYQVFCRPTYAPRELERIQYTPFEERSALIQQLRALTFDFNQWSLFE